MADLILNVGEKKYPFSFEDLTVGRLRQIKGWYGPELGRYMAFIGALRLLDPEAAVCALWVARTAAGEANVPEPNQMPDFPLKGFLEDAEDEKIETTDPPTEGTQVLPTRSSTEIPSDSDENTSDS